jgi:hypothetical protein
MNLWVAFNSCCYNPENSLFDSIASNVAKVQNVNIGIICNNEDRKFLQKLGVSYDAHINADIVGNNGAQIKLDAIERYLPDGDALCDMDVFWTSGFKRPEKLNHSIALNYEPIELYADYSNYREWVLLCLPKNEKTINAGFLYMPTQAFKEYAKQAKFLSQKIKCIGHTYEQMFFVRFSEDNNIDVSCLFNEDVHCLQQIEKCYKLTGIRHPFSFKASLQEIQRCTRMGQLHGDPDFVSWIVNKNFPQFQPMLEHDFFKPLA